MRKDHCERCGKPSHGGVHHVISRGSGGADALENCIQLCYDCHRAAHDGKIGKMEMFSLIARREDKQIEEVEDIAWSLKA